MNSRSKSQGRTFTAGNISFHQFIYHGCCRIMGDISNDGYIRFNSPGDHFGSAKSHFFLNCIYDI